MQSAKLVRVGVWVAVFSGVLLSGVAPAWAEPDGPRPGTERMGPPPGGPEMMPPMLRGIVLTEAQRDRVFDLMYAQAPAQRDLAKRQQKQEDELRTAATGGDINEAKMRGLVDALTKTQGEMLWLRVRTDRQIYDVLTPEQRKQLGAAKPDNAGRGPANSATGGRRGPDEGRCSPPARS